MSTSKEIHAHRFWFVRSQLKAVPIHIAAIGLALSSPSFLVAQQAKTIEAKVRISEEKKRRRVDKDAKLTLDDAARRLIVRAKESPLELNYDDVQRIIIEPDSRTGTVGFGAALAGFAAGGMIFGPKLAASIDNPLKAAHAIYIEYKDSDGKPSFLVLVLGKDEVPTGLKRFKSSFGERVLMPAFPEVLANVDYDKEMDKARLKGTGGCDFKVKASLESHPIPPVRSDKALVVVATPANAGFEVVSTEKWSRCPATILADYEVKAVNGWGTYTYFFLDPGEHLLISRAMNTTGIRVRLEAGKEYYFTQTIYVAGNFRSFLMPHLKEVVMHEMKDLLWSEWKD